jgi:hypothetical protein
VDHSVRCAPVSMYSHRIVNPAMQWITHLNSPTVLPTKSRVQCTHASNAWMTTYSRVTKSTTGTAWTRSVPT